MSGVASADISSLAAALKESGKNADVTTEEVLLHTANYLKTEMEARVPVRTGRLRQSIQVRVSGKTITVGPDTPYAEYVEFGTSPHVISAGPGKTLAFQVGGRMIFVKRVNHPGTKPQPFVRPAFEAWVDTLGGLVAEAHVQRFIKEAS